MSAKERLMSCMRVAKEHLQQYVAIKVQLPSGQCEIIIYGRDLFIEKANYYNCRYDDDLIMINNEEIKIIDFCCANTFEEIEIEMLGE